MAIGTDPSLEPFIASLRQEIETDLAQHQSSASQLHAAAMPPLEQADPELAQYCEELRACTEAQLGAQPQRAAPLPRRRRRVAAIGTFMAAAAALAVVVLSAKGDIAGFGRSLPQSLASLAAWTQTSDDAAQHAIEVRRTQTHRTSTAASTPVPNLEHSEEPQDPLDEDLSAQPTPTTPPPTVAPPPAQPPPRTKKISDAQWLARAQQLWKQGKIAKAQRMYRRIAYRSPDRDAAQAAFADLFSIGRQLGGRSVLVKEWRVYLKKYPKGRYAQDALAGTCAAHEDHDASQSCWKRYLKRFPQGSYAKKARRSLESDG